MSSSLVFEKVWIDRSVYDEAERKYYEMVSQTTSTPLADEVAKARQRLIQIRDNFDATDVNTIDTEAITHIQKKILEMEKSVLGITEMLTKFDSRLSSIESWVINAKSSTVQASKVPKTEDKQKKDDDDDDDMDLFGSDSEDDETAAKIKEERLAAYNAKKSKKPALIAKSSVVLDIKPWDDDTDMKKMEEEVRTIKMDGLLWGASKLVPLAYGIHKLQISCVIEDEKVSVDLLQEQIENFEDYVQSVDIAAFNKI